MHGPKTILVTGGCGFIGSNFIKFLLEEVKDVEILNLDKQTYAGQGRNLEHMRLSQDDRYKLIVGDITNEELVGNLFKEHDFNYIFNFAAESHVDKSWIDDTPFRKTNVIGTGVLLKHAVGAINLKRFVQISCYDKETKTLTKNGLKSFKELKKGDIVFTLNPMTRKLEEQPIEKIIIQDYLGEMVKFDNKRIDLLVTPNHRMYDEKMKIWEADKIKRRFTFPSPTIFKGKKDISKDLMYLIGVFLGDGFTAYQERIIENKSGLNRDDFLKRKDKNGRFIFGKTGDREKIICKSWRIFLDIPENDKARIKTEKVLKNLRIEYTKQKGKSGEHLYFTSEKWVKFFDQFGKGAKNKFIPKEFLEQDGELLRELFNGLIDSDGYRGKTGGIVFNTISEKLKDGICEAGIKIGLIPQVHKRYCGSIFKCRIIKGGWSFQVCFSKRNKSINTYQKGKITKENYDGKIWCITVKNKNFLVERNGKFVFSGNTDEIYGSIQEDSFTENDEPNPCNPYSRCKAEAEVLAKHYAVQYNVPVVITRSANNFGPYQFPEKLLSLFITNLVEGKKVPLMWSEENPGLNVRDWLHVWDNCRAIWHVAQNGNSGEIYNIAGHNKRTNMEMTRKILQYFGYGEEMIEKISHRPSHDFRYSIDDSKLLALGFKHEYTDLDKEIAKLCNWYKNNKVWWEALKK